MQNPVKLLMSPTNRWWPINGDGRAHDVELRRATEKDDDRFVFFPTKNSKSDLFGDGVGLRDVDRVLEVVAARPECCFVVLTRHPRSIEKKLYEVTKDCPIRELGGGDYLRNLWIGVVVENQRDVEEKVSALLNVPSFTKFVYCSFSGAEKIDLTPCLGSWCPKCQKPLLGNPHFAGRACGTCHWTTTRLDWVVAIDETLLDGDDEKKRPQSGESIETLRRQCEKAEIPFYSTE